MGYFPFQRFKRFPRSVELAVRYAQVDPLRQVNFSHKEWTFAVNWFLSGHNSKITLDYTRGEGDLDRRKDERYRNWRLQ